MTDDDSNDNSSGGNNSSSNEISVVKCKLPSFWTNSPETWFIQVEVEFSLHRITNDLTKYNLVVRALPQDVAITITDLLRSRPTVGAYNQIKERLIERHSLSIETRIRKLISDEMIGDRKPSEFYRRLIDLAGEGGTVGQELVKKLWLDRLPNVIRLALIPQSASDEQTLLKVADQLHEATQSSNLCAFSYSNVQSDSQSRNRPFNFNNQSSNNQSNTLSVESLQLEISELKRVIGQLRNAHQNRSRSVVRSRSPAPQRQRSRSRSAYNPKGTHCWYHFRFGNRATKCNKPCSFVNGNAQANALAVNLGN